MNCPSCGKKLTSVKSIIRGRGYKCNCKRKAIDKQIKLDFDKKEETMPETKTMEEYIKEQIENGFIDSKGNPLKCEKCLSAKPFKQVTKSIDGGCVSEFEALCQDCGHQMGYWSYGSWMI